jgi:hypothetical protein
MALHLPRLLDIFYISYDEPNCEDNWDRVKKLLPHAKRVHGVKGFEAAHKACAMASRTPRFITIDGDNWIHDNAFDHTLDDTNMTDVVFSFKSKNIINGLEYGNGGLKSWNAEALLASNTHESSEDTDFCWALRYYQVDKLGSNSVNNTTPFQAWRAGFREGVKMSYVHGKPMKDPRADQALIASSNRSKLHVWMTVGRDAKNGHWAILGARQGFLQVYGGDVPHEAINDYSWFRRAWDLVPKKDIEEQIRRYGKALKDRYDLYLPEFDAEGSIWFKRTYVNPPRSGLML